MHPCLRTVDHRPWPLPATPWIWRQAWRDLAFFHYRIDAAPLRPRLPAGLTLQEYDGSAWLGLVPFRMSGIMPRGLPAVPTLSDLPLISNFPELNLRTYVEKDGKPGVWFFSLDADSWAIVSGGRSLYALPYFKAEMSQAWTENECDFRSARRSAGVRFAARYRPVGEVFYATHGTFEHWATERYCLYSGPKATRLEVHHAPWPLQRAEVSITRNDIFAASQLSVDDQVPVCHFSTGVEVVSFSPDKTVKA